MSIASYPNPIELDWRGMSCPEPILETARAVRQLKGQMGLFDILADDDAFPMDLKSWCRSAKAEVLDLQRVDGGSYRAKVVVNRQEERPSKPAKARAPITKIVPAKSTEVMDLRGLNCPEPILKLAKAVRAIKAEQFELKATADDPAFPMDVKSWARSSGLEVVGLVEVEGTWHAHLRKGSPKAKATAPEQVLPAAPLALVRPEPHTDVALKLDLSNATPQDRLKRLAGLEQMGMQGSEVLVRCDDAGMNAALVRWCGQGGHEILSLKTTPELVAHLRMGPGQSEALVPGSSANALARTDEAELCTLLVLHNDFEALMAALMTATAAAAGGMKVNIFFSFWGVNLLRGEKPQDTPPKTRPNILQRAFAWMMPKGPGRQQLGKLNFGGMGTGIMRGIMRKNNVMDLEQLMDSAIQQDVRFTVCTTSMSIMGLDKRDIKPLSNVDFGGVASFVDSARGAGMSLVF